MEDRSWMYCRYVAGVRGITIEFEEGVKSFISFAMFNARSGMIRYHCAKCKNMRFESPDTVVVHLYKKGFVARYHEWTCHGEGFDMSGQASSTTVPMNEEHLSDMIRKMVFEGASIDFNIENTEEPPNREAKKFYDMLEAANIPIWDGYTKHTQLSLVSRLLNIKSENNISEKCFNQFVQLLKEAVPNDDNIPNDFYEMRRLVSGLGLPVQRIDVCPNGCMIYWKADLERRECKFCGHARYLLKRKVRKNKQQRDIAYSKMFYFSITPRLQRLYASQTTAEHMRWHFESKHKDGHMSHPKDGEAWKHFDRTHPDFANEMRNVRLGLCTDGFSPFGMSGKQYSCWPIIMVPYNLPPWMCMKDPFMFLTIIKG